MCHYPLFQRQKATFLKIFFTPQAVWCHSVKKNISKNVDFSHWFSHHKITMVPFNSALKTTQKNQIFKYGGQKHWAIVPNPTVSVQLGAAQDAVMNRILSKKSMGERNIIFLPLCVPLKRHQTTEVCCAVYCSNRTCACSNTTILRTWWNFALLGGKNQSRVSPAAHTW